MPTPREQAQKLGLREPDYCGVCGVPKHLCTCLQYKEFGAEGAVKAGSASADKGPPMKGAEGNPNDKKPSPAPEGVSEKKKASPGAKLPFGEKKKEE